MRFEEAYVAYHEDIRRLSRKQAIPGMESDDVESEMLIVLWKAAETYDPNLGSLWGRFWTMWSNRRKNILKAFFAESRPRVVYTDTMPEKPFADLYVPIGPDLPPVEAEAWKMLMDGDTAKEIKEDLGLSQRGYYSMIHSWRTEEIHDLLT